jgi:hypothetical protein
MPRQRYYTPDGRQVPDRDTDERQLDQFNRWLGSLPQVQEWKAQRGMVDTGRGIRMSDRHQAEFERWLGSQGIRLPDGMHIDGAGNINQHNTLLRNIGIGAAIGAGAYFGGPALMSAFSGGGGGAAGGAAAGGAAGGGGAAAGGTGLLASTGWTAPMAGYAAPVASGLVPGAAAAGGGAVAGGAGISPVLASNVSRGLGPTFGTSAAGGGAAAGTTAAGSATGGGMLSSPWVMPALEAAGFGLNAWSNAREGDANREHSLEIEQSRDARERDLALLDTLTEEGGRDPYSHVMAQMQAMALLDRIINGGPRTVAAGTRYQRETPGAYTPEMRSAAGTMRDQIASGRAVNPTATDPSAPRFTAIDLLSAIGSDPSAVAGNLGPVGGARSTTSPWGRPIPGAPPSSPMMPPPAPGGPFVEPADPMAMPSMNDRAAMTRNRSSSMGQGLQPDPLMSAALGPEADRLQTGASRNRNRRRLAARSPMSLSYGG